jgi:hypothetical protein
MLSTSGRGVWIRCGLLLVASVATASSPMAAERIMNIMMEDQFRSRCETGVYRGDVVVLVYAERHGAEAGLELGRRLHLHFHPTAADVAAEGWSKQPVIGLAGWPEGVRVPDVRVIPVASLTEVPKALQPVARARMRKDSPHVPVWLDFEGTMKNMFGIIQGQPNVVILDAEGRVHSVLSGHLDDVRFGQLVSLVDQIRGTARPPIQVATQPSNAPVR